MINSFLNYYSTFVLEKLNYIFVNMYYIPLIISALYLLFCKYGPIYMSNRDAFKLNNELCLWNGFLALFSLIGSIITIPSFFKILFNNGFMYTLCDKNVYEPGAVSFWIMLFTFSKIPELLDTVFIILKKKPLIFLHYYHHASVLVVSWYVYAVKGPYGVYFACMNYFVHTLMYSYYFLSSLEMIPKWFNPKIITNLQILQMVMGTIVTISSYYYSNFNKCVLDKTNLHVSLAMYISYYLLFMNFAYERYSKKIKK